MCMVAYAATSYFYTNVSVLLFYSAKEWEVKPSLKTSDIMKTEKQNTVDRK